MTTPVLKFTDPTTERLTYVDAFTTVLITKREPVFTLERAMLILLEYGFNPRLIAQYVDAAFYTAQRLTEPNTVAK